MADGTNVKSNDTSELVTKVVGVGAAVAATKLAVDAVSDAVANNPEILDVGQEVAVDVIGSILDLLFN